MEGATERTRAIDITPRLEILLRSRRNYFLRRLLASISGPRRSRSPSDIPRSAGAAGGLVKAPRSRARAPKESSGYANANAAHTNGR